MPRKQTSQTQSAQKAQVSEEVSYDIITTDSWEAKSHNCGPAKPNKSGQGKSAPFTYNKRRFFLKVPKMYCPFGASKPKPKPGEKEPENPAWSIQMAFGDDVGQQVFQKKVTDFDEFMVDEATKPENNASWLGASKTKPFSREVVESKYSRMLKRSVKDGEVQTQYPPFIRAQLPTTFKAPYEFTCEIYDKDNNLIDVSPNPTSTTSINKVITSGCFVSALLSGSIWANATQFGVTWRIAQLKVFPAKGLPKGKCLVDDPEDNDDENDDEHDEQDDKSASAPKQSTASAPASTNTTSAPATQSNASTTDADGEEDGVEVVDDDTADDTSANPVATPAPAPVVTPVAAKVAAPVATTTVAKKTVAAKK